MKRRLSEAAARKIMQHLLEKFGEPIGKALDAGPGVADERGGHPHKGKDPGNYGFGAMDEMAVCQHCGMMHDEMDAGSACEGEMAADLDDLDEAQPKKGKAKKKTTWADINKSDWDRDARNYEKYGSPSGWGKPVKKDAWGSTDELDEITPPGREKQVKALKKDKKVKNPWAVAWASYNRSHKR